MLKRERIIKRYYPYILLLPVFSIIGVVLAYPWIWTLVLSLYKYSPLYPEDTRFIGLQNYLKVFSDSRFISSLGKTGFVVAGSLTVEILVGLGLALLLNMNLKGRKVFRLLILLPYMLTPAVVGLMWRVMLHNEWGLVNYFLGMVHLPKLRWLSDPNLTLPVIVLMESWIFTPFVTIVLLAGLQAIPIEQTEAARVDGATRPQIFRFITVPWLRPLLLLVFVFQLMHSLRVFATVYSLFRSPGPANAGMVLGIYLYETFRMTWDIGLTSSISYILLLITALSSVYFIVRLYRRMT